MRSVRVNHSCSPSLKGATAKSKSGPPRSPPTERNLYVISVRIRLRFRAGVAPRADATGAKIGDQSRPGSSFRQAELAQVFGHLIKGGAGENHRLFEFSDRQARVSLHHLRESLFRLFKPSSSK